MQFMYKNALNMRDLDLNGLTLRRLTLYPTEVRGLIRELDKYAVYMRDLGMNDLLLRRLTLYPTEVRRQIYCGIFRFLICVFNGIPLYTENC